MSGPCGFHSGLMQEGKVETLLRMVFDSIGRVTDWAVKGSVLDGVGLERVWWPVIFGAIEGFYV